MPDFEPLAAAFKRVVNIIKKADDIQAGEIKAELFEHPSEAALVDAYESVKRQIGRDVAGGSFDQAFLKIATLRDTVDDFFEGVMVMADDMDVRRNRLLILAQIAALFGKIADFSKIST
jgi:glycyl-tRNA synthetase beta chain